VIGKTILVPLTNSLYVPGTLADTENVLVDIGTGYYVEKSAADAEKFYNGKVENLTKNLTDLEKIVSQKSQNVRIVEDGAYLLPPMQWRNRLLTDSGW
jgi:prefoldin alpha subunit